MRVILETHSGPLSGNKVELKPGEQVRVGRTSKSDFAFPGDSRMSGIHFVVECSEHSCRVIDANSRNGIRLNGEKVSEKTLADGDQLVAGETRFLVRIEGNEPEDRLLAMLRGQFQPLYAVLDAAREPDVLKLLVESEAEYQSLFAGKDGARLTHFAPHLVRLPEESPLLEMLARNAWGKSWGIYLTCDLDFASVRRHFRRFLMVNQPGGKQVYFRFYDPRVLRVYLATCLPEEMNPFFGPVKYYLMEDEKPDTLLRFSNAGRGVGLRKFPLVSEPKTQSGTQVGRPSTGRDSPSNVAR